jgi:hypothetical protein
MSKPVQSLGIDLLDSVSMESLLVQAGSRDVVVLPALV